MLIELRVRDYAVIDDVTLSLGPGLSVLSGETGDRRLACLRVASVQPAPDSSRLLVTVLADCPPDEFRREEMEERLHASAGRLRTAVAEAITRRKAPTLAFVLLGSDGEGESHG